MADDLLSRMAALLAEETKQQSATPPIRNINERLQAILNTEQSGPPSDLATAPPPAPPQPGWLDTILHAIPGVAQGFVQPLMDVGGFLTEATRLAAGGTVRPEDVIPPPNTPPTVASETIQEPSVLLDPMEFVKGALTGGVMGGLAGRPALQIAKQALRTGAAFQTYGLSEIPGLLKGMVEGFRSTSQPPTTPPQGGDWFMPDGTPLSTPKGAPVIPSQRMLLPAPEGQRALPPWPGDQRALPPDSRFIGTPEGPTISPSARQMAGAEQGPTEVLAPPLRPSLNATTSRQVEPRPITSPPPRSGAATPQVPTQTLPPFPVEQGRTSSRMALRPLVDARAPMELKSRAASIDAFKGDLSAFDQGGKFDYLSKLKLSPQDEANRRTLNLIIHFENQTLDPAMVNMASRSKDSGLFQIGQPLAKQLKLAPTTNAAEQLRQMEGIVLPYKKKVLGTDDPNYLALGHLNERFTRAAMAKAQTVSPSAPSAGMRTPAPSVETPPSVQPLPPMPAEFKVTLAPQTEPIVTPETPPVSPEPRPAAPPLHADTPPDVLARMQGAAQERAATVTSHSNEPPVPQGFTRLYRGDTSSSVKTGVPDWIEQTEKYAGTKEATGRWFNATYDEAKYYADEFGFGGGRVTYVDIPTADVEKYRASNLDAKKFSAVGMADKEFFLPKDIASTSRPIQPPGRSQPKLIETQATMPPTALQAKAPQVEHGDLLAGFKPPELPAPELPMDVTSPTPTSGAPAPSTPPPLAAGQSLESRAAVLERAGFPDIADALRGKGASVNASTRPVTPVEPPLSAKGPEPIPPSEPPQAPTMAAAEGQTPPPPSGPTEPPKKGMPTMAGGGPRGAEVIAETEGGTMGSPLINPNLRLSRFKYVVETATEHLKSLGLKPTPGQQVSDFLIESIGSNKVPLDDLYQFMAHRGIAEPQTVLLDAFADLRSLGGRTLNVLSQAMKSLEGVPNPTPPQAQTLSFLKSLDLLRRKLMIGQVSTMVRNVETQGMRLGSEPMVTAFEQAVGRVTNKLGISDLPEEAILRGVERYTRLAARPGQNAATVERLLENRPSIKTRLFGTYSNLDPELRQPAILRPLHKAVDVLLIPNKAQEFYYRRIAFLAKLEERLQGRGVTTALNKIDPRTISMDDLQSATSHALDMTWASGQALGETGNAISRAITSLPFIGTAPMPYPQFMMNSLRFLWDFSPASAVAPGLRVGKAVGMRLAGYDLLSAGEKAAISAGDVNALAKAMTGTLMLGTAYQLRDSKYAGPRPWELLIGGKKVDLRPFGPFAGMLTIAEAAKQLRQHGNLKNLPTQDLVEGIASTSFRAGAGLFILENMSDMITGIEGGWDKQQTVRTAKRLTGEVAASFLTPLRTISDAMSVFNPGELVMREKGLEPFAGPIKEMIPGVRQSLPPLASATRATPLERESGWMRQLPPGITLSTPTFVENELGKIGLRYRDIVPALGQPEYEWRLKQQMGPVIEQVMGTLFKTPGYQALDTEQRTLAANQTIAMIREQAKVAAFQKLSPGAQFEVLYKRVPRFERPLLERRPEFQSLKNRVQGQGTQ